MDRFIPIHGWPVKINGIKDDSRERDDPGTEIEAWGRVWPNDEGEYLRLAGKEFHADVEIVVMHEDLASKMYHELIDGSHVIVSGDLSYRSARVVRPEIRTTLWVNDYYVDKTEGKVTPLVGQVLCACPDEYKSAMLARYEKQCPHCGEDTEEVATEYTRYCPNCEI